MGATAHKAGANLGADEATNVTDAYKQGDNRFTSKIHKVTVEVKQQIAEDCGVSRRLLFEADDGQ
jgi:hypothetical protein